MMRNRLPIVAFLVVLGILPVGCTSVSPVASHEDAVVIEPIEGSELHRVTLSATAAERLDIQTAAVEEVTIDGRQRTVLPYGAVLWDAEGAAWAYTSPETGVFVRAPLTIDRIDGDQALLTEGPAPGTTVVTVGAAELWGAETGVGGGH